MYIFTGHTVTTDVAYIMYNTVTAVVTARL